MQTLSQEIEGADVALIAELIQPMPTSERRPARRRRPPPSSASSRSSAATSELAGAKEIDVVYFGDESPRQEVHDHGPRRRHRPGPRLDDARAALDRAPSTTSSKLPTVPAEGADRLAFFQDYLEDDDPLLAQDAYDEFARTPYAEVIELGPRMNRATAAQVDQDSGSRPLRPPAVPHDAQHLRQARRRGHARRADELRLRRR